MVENLDRHRAPVTSAPPGVGACLLLGLAMVPALSAQEPAADQPFFETVEVNVVNIEVMVTDKDGTPVTGLGREDFEVFEDGKPVELTNFFAVEGRQTRASQASGDGLDGDLPLPATQRLNLVVFIDNFNLDPRNRNVILGRLRDYLQDRLDPRDRVMLVDFDARVQVPQKFTNDPEPLVTQIDRLAKKTGRGMLYQNDREQFLSQLMRSRLVDRNEAADLGVNDGFEFALSEARSLAGGVRVLAERGHQRTLATIAALRHFTSMLAGMRGRKAVLYVTDGVHRQSGQDLAQAWLNKFEIWLTANREPSVASDVRSLFSSPYDATREFDDLIKEASANQVTFYPISNAGGIRGGGQVNAEFGGVSPSDGRGPRSPGVVAMESSSLQGSILEIAQGTGGVAFTQTPNIVGLLERVTNDFQTFYSLGYTRPHEADDKFHDVKVKVRRKGVKVRHLRGYRDKDPMAHLQDLTLSALRLGVGDNPLEVSLQPGEQVHTKGRRYHVSVLVKIPFKTLLLLPQEESHVARLTAVVIVEDDQGGVSPAQRLQLPIRVPNERILEVMGQTAAYPMKLEMERGYKRLSVGIRDHLGRVDSTVSLELTVGDESG